MTERVPPLVEAAIKADLHAVRPLPSPWKRVLWVLPVAVLTLLAASSVFALRDDASTLGWILTWGTSTLQSVFALSLIALALGEAVPGRSLHTSALVAVAASVLGFSMVVTLRTWDLSPTMIVPDMVAWVGEVCFIGTIASALPLLVAAAVLASRAFVLRPWASGALFGLGAGLGADAGWRLFCHYSDPVHVFPTHTGAVVATMLLGILVAQPFKAAKRGYRTGTNSASTPGGGVVE
jgi:hypothetical protein